MRLAGHRHIQDILVEGILVVALAVDSQVVALAVGILLLRVVVEDIQGPLVVDILAVAALELFAFLASLVQEELIVLVDIEEEVEDIAQIDVVDIVADLADKTEKQDMVLALGLRQMEAVQHNRAGPLYGQKLELDDAFWVQLGTSYLAPDLTV